MTIQLGVTTSVLDYRNAAELLWGAAGAWSVDQFITHNEVYFDGELPPLPIVIGITAYGNCIGLTRCHATPRITLASNTFTNLTEVSDTILHEMVHAVLHLRVQVTDHNALPWCQEITRISRAFGHEITAEPVRVRRVPNPNHGDADPRKTITTRQTAGDGLTRRQLSRWPHSIRPSGWYDGADSIYVDTY